MPYDGSNFIADLQGYSGLGERSPRRNIPFFDHVRGDVVALRDGRLMAMYRVEGSPFYLSANSGRNGKCKAHIGILQLLSDRHTEITEHLCVDRASESFDLGDGGTAYAREFWSDYMGGCLSGARRVEWYICVSVRPTLKSLKERLAARRRGEVGVDAHALRLLEGKCQALESAMRWHGIRRLGQTLNPQGTLCSEIGRALVYVRSLRDAEFPMSQPAGTFAGTLYTDNVLHGPLGFLQLRDGGMTGATVGRMYNLKGYPIEPIVGMNDRLIVPQHGTPMTAARFVMTNHARPIERAAARGALQLIFNRLVSVDSQGTSDLKDIVSALDDLVTGKEVRARHAWCMAVHADTVAELDVTASEIVTMLKGAGCTPVAAGLASEDVYWGQWHGNLEMTNRAARIGMRAFAMMSGLDGFPRFMADAPRWDHPLMWFLTPGLTVRPFDMHSMQNGNMLFLAPTRSGKTVLMGALQTMATFVVGGDGLIFTIDKDRSNHLTIKNNGGSYTVAQRGDESGFAPLKALTNLPENRAIIFDLLRGMILADDPALMTPVEADQLAEGIAACMELPRHLRSIGFVHSFLPPGSAANRLKPWCWGERRGWAFDGEVDTVRFDRIMCGIDLTALLDDGEVLPLVAHYLLHRLRQQTNGKRRCILICEEAKFFLSKPYLREAFDDASRTGGKKNCPIWLVTQQPEDILGLPNGSGTLAQFRTRWFLKNEYATREVYCGGLHCTEQEFEQVSGKMAGGPWSVLLQRPEGESELLRFDLKRPGMERHAVILSGNPATCDIWDALEDELGTDDPSEIRPVFLKRVQQEKDNAERKKAKARAARYETA